jgi:protease-4
MDPRFGQLIQSAINHTYSEFTVRAAKARKTTPDKIDAVAQGRVWTGAQAHERGLVDTLGSYGDALRSAAKRAKIEGEPRIIYIERETSRVDRLVEFFGGSSAKAMSEQVKLALLPSGLPLGVARDMAQDLNWLNQLTAERKPFMALTHCLCSSPD